MSSEEYRNSKQDDEEEIEEEIEEEVDTSVLPMPDVTTRRAAGGPEADAARLRRALDLLFELAPQRGGGDLQTQKASVMAMLAVDAVLASMKARCRRRAPPEPIEITTDSGGALIYRCSHKPAHTWPV